MKKVSVPKVVTTLEATESPLPSRVQEALGELVGAAREGLLALSVGVGLGPRMRTADDQHELPLQTYEYFADRDPLTRAVMDRMLAGVSTRRYAAVGEPVGEHVEQSSSTTSKSSVSEMFIERTTTALEELMSRRLDDVRLALMMLDGLEIANRCHVVALGITTEGIKIPLGLWEGSTENATLAKDLLADLVDRGLDPEQAILFVIDGAKALRKAIREVFGEHALVQRCQRHKERNVTDLLPERSRDGVRERMRQAWALTDAQQARQRRQTARRRARPQLAGRRPLAARGPR